MSRDGSLRRWPAVVACLLAFLAHGPAARGAQSTTAAADAKPLSVGILPVSAVVGVEHVPLRRSLEAALDTHFLGLSGVQVVDRTHVALFLEELTRSKVNRRDLQVGQIVGAEVLVASQLTAGRGKDVELKLSAVETATGTVLLERSATLADGIGGSIDGVVRGFAAEVPARRPASAARVDVAVLPIGYAGPIDQDAGLTDGIRQRLSQALAANPALRVLHRDMGQVVLNESALAAGGLVDPKRRFAPVAGVVLVEGTLTQTLAQGKALDESTLALKLTVRRRGQAGEPAVVQSRASFRDAAKLEQDVTAKLAAAVAGVAGMAGRPAAPTTSPDADRADRHWEAQRYVQEARQVLRQLGPAPTANDLEKQAHAIDLLLRAANLAPDDPQPYVVLWQELLGRVSRGGPDADRRAGKEQAAAIRRRFIDGFPSHETWPTAVLDELMSLRWNDKQTPEERKASVALSERFADVLLARQVEMSFKYGNGEYAPGYAGSDVVRSAAFVLMEDGQVERAWRLCMAGADLIDQTNDEPWGHEILNNFIVKAIHLDRLDDAWRAAQYMQALYPGYRPINFDATWNEPTTPIQKLRAAGQLDKWQAFIRGKEFRRGQGPDTHWLSDQLMTIQSAAAPVTVDVDKTELAGPVAHALPGSQVPAVGRAPDPRRLDGPNPIIAMSAGPRPWCLVRNGFNEKEKLWRAGAAAITDILGAPQIAPHSFGDRRMGYPPTIVEFDGVPHVTTVGDGIYRIDPNTGWAALAAPGLPKGHTSALLAHGDSLYACGGSGGDEARDPGRGFVARLDRGAATWKVWTAPAKSGQVHDLSLLSAPADKPDSPTFLAFHRGTLRVSEFRPGEAGDDAWKDVGGIKADGSQPVGFAHSGSTVLRFDELMVYRFERGERFRFTRTWLCPPVTAGEHYWMWYPPNWWRDMKGIGGGKNRVPVPGPVPPWQLAVATLGGVADVAADPTAPGRFWVADLHGGLSVLEDGRGVAGPFKVAARSVRLKVSAEGVCINTGVGVVEVPRTALDRRLADPAAWRTPEQVYATAMDRLDAWAAKLPTVPRGVYFCCVHQVERGEKAFAEVPGAVPIAALPQRLTWLINGGMRERALELIEPYVRDVGLLTEPELESTIISVMQQAGEWKRLDEFIPRLWRESPLRGAAVCVSDRANGYIYARKKLVSPEQFQREMAEILAGKLPETPWKWDENPVYRCFARDIRRWARLAMPKKPPATKPAGKAG